MKICMFVGLSFVVQLDFFYSYGDVIITDEGLHCLFYAASLRTRMNYFIDAKYRTSYQSNDQNKSIEVLIA